MFFYDSTGFVALVCLLVQCSLAWVFAAFFGVLSHGRPAWQRSFFAAFVCLAIALTAMSVRFVLPHIVFLRSFGFGEENPVVRSLYGIYLGGKILFVGRFVSGAVAWRGHELTPPAWMTPVIAVAGFGVGFALTLASVLWIQAALVVAACAVTFVLLRPRDERDRKNPGRATVRLVAVLMAIASTIYVLAVLPAGVLPEAVHTVCHEVLKGNAILDMVLQVIMAIGLIVAVMIDAQDRIVSATEERDRLRSQVQRDDKLRVSATLIGGVAHEINNPLTAIIGYGEDLSSEDVSVRQHAVKVVREQAARCRAIVKRMSAIGRRRLLTTSSFRVTEIVNRVVDGMRMQLSERSIGVACEVPPQLMLVADAAGFEQVLTNLLGNAMHVSARGQDIEVHVDPSPEGAVMTVRDHGPGVPEKARGQIFEPFWTTKRPSHGTGLGLAVVDAIVHAHGGKIEVRDAVGGGAEFCTVWPWRAVSTPQSPAPTPPAPIPRARIPSVPIPSVSARPKPQAHTAGGRLLVIDDEQSVRLTIRRYVELSGWQVDEAESAEVGLSRLLDGSETYDAIICDIRMPGMNGTEFHAELRTRAPELLPRLLFVTGDIASQDVATFAHQEDVDILAKPFVLDELMQRLNESLERSATAAKSTSQT